VTQIIVGHRVATCTSFWTGGAVVVDDGGHRVATCTYLTGGNGLCFIPRRHDAKKEERGSSAAEMML
jgi:hypothetical protein